jgi:hypothetical protein
VSGSATGEVGWVVVRVRRLEGRHVCVSRAPCHTWESTWAGIVVAHGVWVPMLAKHRSKAPDDGSAVGGARANGVVDVEVGPARLGGSYENRSCTCHVEQTRLRLLATDTYIGRVSRAEDAHPRPLSCAGHAVGGRDRASVPEATTT